jgi:hypothetical protein
MLRHVFKLLSRQRLPIITVPDMRSRDHEVVVARRTINLGTGNLEWGGVEKGEVSSRVTWDQGGQDPITARRVSK